MTLDWNNLILVFYSLAIGLVLGLERELKNKPAGLRTLALVTMGSCIFTLISINITNTSYDRIAANIVTGVGFLGAGAIFRDDNKVNGLTTAALIWTSAALGMCVGIGYVLFAFVIALTVVALLWTMNYLENLVTSKIHLKEYTITFKGQTTDDCYQNLMLTFSKLDVRARQIGFSKREDHYMYKWNITTSQKKHNALVNLLLQNKCIIGLEY